MWKESIQRCENQCLVSYIHAVRIVSSAPNSSETGTMLHILSTPINREMNAKFKYSFNHTINRIVFRQSSVDTGLRCVGKVAIRVVRPIDAQTLRIIQAARLTTNHRRVLTSRQTTRIDCIGDQCRPITVRHCFKS